MAKLILFNKPFGVLSQFTDLKSPTKRPTLSDYIPVPHVYPAGRLDKDSEGLMVLTDDGALQAKISSPKYKAAKTYLVQVEGIPNDEELAPLRRGVKLNDGVCRPADVACIPQPELWQRQPPVRYRKTVPDSWLSITLREGRNRQVRRMTAAIGYPTLRLVRTRIGDWQLGHLQPGQWIEQQP